MAVQPVDFIPNQLVFDLAKDGPEVLPGATPTAAIMNIVPAAFTPVESPKRYCFVGFVGTPFRAFNRDWCVLYQDWELETYVLIEQDGVVRREMLPQVTGEPAAKDALWVKAETAVSSGHGALSIEGLFLMGNFTRAADFEVESLLGGTAAAATGGYGLAGQSPPRCCYKTNRRP
jgi:hypothetical protein